MTTINLLPWRETLREERKQEFFVSLGGVFREETTTTISKTMFFGDLPYIGGLFRRTANSETKTELLIFITPSILNDG